MWFTTASGNYKTNLAAQIGTTRFNLSVAPARCVIHSNFGQNAIVLYKHGEPAMKRVSMSEQMVQGRPRMEITKMPRNEAKIYQETDFRNTEGHLLTSSDCVLLHWTLYRLDLRLSRFF